MKRILSVIFATLLFTCMYSYSFSACDPNSTSSVNFIRDCALNSGGGVGLDTPQGVAGVKDLIIKIAERALQFGGLFAIGAIVWSGIRYTTAYGDDEKIKGAKSTALYAGIGLILMLVAFPLVDVIVNFIYSFSS